MKAHVVKQAEVYEIRVGGNTFYLRPFPAFKTVFISGELSTTIGPLLSAAAPFLAADGGSLDMEIGAMAPAIVTAFNSLSGDKLERLMKNLLINYKNITVDIEGEDAPQVLTETLSNELFCCDVQDMFILAFFVIKYNFSGFFKKFGDQFGKVSEWWTGLTSNSTEHSTAAGSAT